VFFVHFSLVFFVSTSFFQFCYFRPLFLPIPEADLLFLRIPEADLLFLPIPEADLLFLRIPEADLYSVQVSILLLLLLRG